MIVDPRKVHLLEEDVEQWLFENPQLLPIHEPYHIEKWLFRQYQLPSGIADLIGLTNCGAVAVIEVKNVPINKAAVLQVCRYAADIEQIMQKRPHGYEECFRLLIGPSIDRQTYLEACACRVDVITFTPRLELAFGRLSPIDYWRNSRDAISDLASTPQWEEVDNRLASFHEWQEQSRLRNLQTLEDQVGEILADADKERES